MLTHSAPLTLKSALVGIGFAVAAIIFATSASTSAKAEGFSFGLSITDGYGTRHYGDHQRNYGHFSHRENPFGYSEHRKKRRHLRRCSPRKALYKARHFGVRHAKIKRYGRKGVLIKGRKNGERVFLSLDRRCYIARVSYR